MENLKENVSISKLSKTEEIKFMIIENYIDWFTSNEEERDNLKNEALNYVIEDWVDEIGQSKLLK